MAHGEDEERLKIEIKAGRAVSFDCMRRKEKRKGRRKGRLYDQSKRWGDVKW